MACLDTNRSNQLSPGNSTQGFHVQLVGDFDLTLHTCLKSRKGNLLLLCQNAQYENCLPTKQDLQCCMPGGRHGQIMLLAVQCIFHAI